MKTHALRTSILALVVAAAGYAQSSPRLRADVPFNFVAGGVTLTAGNYSVNQDRPGVVFIKALDGKANAVLFADAVAGANIQSASKLVFHRYGNTYLLSQVWTAGTSRGLEAPVTSRERELIAKHTAPDETIILALR